MSSFVHMVIIAMVMSLCIAIHTDDMCYFTGLLDGDVFLSYNCSARIGVYDDTKHKFLECDLEEKYGDKCFAPAEAPLFTWDITHVRCRREMSVAIKPSRCYVYITAKLKIIYMFWNLRNI